MSPSILNDVDFFIFCSMTRSILTPRQRAVLAVIGRDKALTHAFYLTGGTALAEFYLQHRYSEDLDFFSTNNVDPAAITAFWQSVKKSLGIRKIDFQQSFNRNLFFLHFPKEILKTEFTYFPFLRIQKETSVSGIEIDSLYDIAVNKLFTIYQQCRARDYIDLYMICAKEGYTIKELIKAAKVKFDWHIDVLQLGTQFIKSQEAKDYPRMIVTIKDREWQQFFISEAKKFKKDIFDKS